MALQGSLVKMSVVDDPFMPSSIERKIAYRTFDDCYIKVVELVGNKDKMMAVVAYKWGDTPIYQYSYGFVPDLDGPNFIKQAYEHLKTLPEFTDATDV